MQLSHIGYRIYRKQAQDTSKTGAPARGRRAARFAHARGNTGQRASRRGGGFGGVIFQLFPEKIRPFGLLRPDLVPRCLVARASREKGSNRPGVDRGDLSRNRAAGRRPPGGHVRSHRPSGQDGHSPGPSPDGRGPCRSVPRPRRARRGTPGEHRPEYGAPRVFDHLPRSTRDGPEARPAGPRRDVHPVGRALLGRTHSKRETAHFERSRSLNGRKKAPETIHRR